MVPVWSLEDASETSLDESVLLCQSTLRVLLDDDLPHLCGGLSQVEESRGLLRSHLWAAGVAVHGVSGQRLTHEAEVALFCGRLKDPSIHVIDVDVTAGNLKKVFVARCDDLPTWVVTVSRRQDAEDVVGFEVRFGVDPEQRRGVGFDVSEQSWARTFPAALVAWVERVAEVSAGGAREGEDNSEVFSDVFTNRTEDCSHASLEVA